MKADGWKFALVGLGISLFLAIVISPFASSSPDGLESVAQDHGFFWRAEENEPAWNASPIPDYSIPGVESEFAATALAGLAGTLVVFSASLVIGRAIRKRRNGEAD